MSSCTIIVNGKPHATRAECTVAELLRELGAVPARVAVMVNDDVVPADRRATRLLHAGDRVEIVIFAGGGAWGRVRGTNAQRRTPHIER